MAEDIEILSEVERKGFIRRKYEVVHMYPYFLSIPPSRFDPTL